MIDLHLHTTASDGTLAPAALVREAVRAGITVLSVTDHDTTAGLDEARTASLRFGARLVNGIEITAVERGRDVHVLGYFFDPAAAALRAFLERQRADRRRRVAEMAQRLEALGCRVDLESLLRRADDPAGRSIGRPQLADALVAIGRAANRREAFDEWLGEGRPAYVPRRGPSPAEVIDVLHAAGGIAVLAHPGLLQMDDIIPAIAASGLDGIEVRHSDHDRVAEERYRELARALGLAMSGGSDFHGEPSRTCELGEVWVPEPDFAALEARAASRRA